MGIARALWCLGSLSVLAWMFSRLVRAPRHPPLWAVTALVACWAAMVPFAMAANAEAGLLGLAPMTCRLVQCVLLQAGATCIVYFFLFSALDLREARRRAAWYALPLVAAVAVQTAAALSVPAGVRTTDNSVTGVMVVYLADVLYMALVFAIAWVWTRRYARKAEPRLARGLRIASLGEAGIVVADCLFVPVQLMRWADDGTNRYAFDPGDPASTLSFVARAFLLPGATLLLAGLSYQSTAMRLAALRIWWQHLRAYHRLRPLWTVLHRHFPEDTLDGAPAGRRRDVISLRGVHRRYYRRVIECRDGLVHISPYLAAVRDGDGDGDGDGEEPPAAAILADRLGEALRARTAGAPVSTAAMPVGVPAEGNGSLDADARELIALSRALRTAGSDGG